MQIQEGDGLNGQPAEGDVSLESMANDMDDTDTPLDDSEDEASEEAEVEQDDDEAEEEDDAEEPTFTIKVDGKDVTLKQSELVELGQKGLDYTTKTMAVAEERKAVQAEREQASQLRQQVEHANQEALSRLEAWTQYMEANVGQPPDVALLDYDTAAYLKGQQVYEARKGQLQQAYAATQALQQEQHRQRQAVIADRAAATEQVLRSTLPGWNDDTLHTLADYAKGLGLSPQNANEAMLEPGFWQLAQKAKAFDELQAKKATMKPVAQLPKVQKPGNTNQPPQNAKRQEALRQFKAKPSANALANLL